jgi:hypothetical protein
VTISGERPSSRAVSATRCALEGSGLSKSVMALLVRELQDGEKNRKASRIPAYFGTVCSWFGSILSGFPHIDEIAGRSGPERGAASSPIG